MFSLVTGTLQQSNQLLVCSSMGAVATFDYAAWKARYPEFNTVSSSLAGQYFVEAGLYLNNTGAGPVADAPTQLMLLNMLVAHIAKLNAVIENTPASDLVGRINNASEGSVSVGAEADLPPGSPQWFAQTKYGFAFWQATARFRRMNYIPGPTRNQNPWFGRGRGF